MSTFILLTRLSPSERSPRMMEELEKKVMERIHSECPKVKWIHNYAVLGPFDYLDIFEAPDFETAFRVSTIVRSFGHAQTEVWGATEWAAFKEMIRRLPEGG